MNLRKIVREQLEEMANPYGPEVDFSTGSIMLLDKQIGNLSLHKREDGLYVILDKIEIFPEYRGNGYAQKAMGQLIDYANKKNLIITLTPDDAFGSNKNKLIKWYQSLGFVLNHGKKKDFETMQLMYKLPS